MFKITTDRVFWWPVPVRSPDPDPAKAGKMVEHVFKVKFVGLKSDAVDAEFKRISDEHGELNLEGQKKHFLLSVTRDWGDILGEDDQPVPFSGETLGAILDDQYVRRAMWDGYLQAVSGEEVKLGN